MHISLTRQRGSNSVTGDITRGDPLLPTVDLREGDTYSLLLTSNADGDSSTLHQIELILSGAYLQPSWQGQGKDGAITHRWEWPIDFYAGAVSLPLRTWSGSDAGVALRPNTAACNRNG